MSAGLNVQEDARKICTLVELDLDYHSFPSDPIVELAQEYGGTLQSIEQVYQFYWTCKPKHQPYGSIEYRWMLTASCVLMGFLKSGKLHDAKDVIRAASFVCGDTHWAEVQDALIVEKGFRLLKTKEDILALAGALKSYKGTIMLSIALGYQPLTSFADAVDLIERENLAVEEKRRQSSFIGG
jgi:hypothetical protein